VTDTQRDVLAHLHANPATGAAALAAALGLSEPDVRAAVDALVDAGHVERQGDRLVPDPASRTTPGLFVASERRDADPVETELPERGSEPR
jgi:DNA-binding IclR family transcriptional regulator